jgi:hypothetical protein
VLIDGTSVPSLTGVSYQLGSGGIGGTSTGNNGANGRQANTYAAP